MNFLRNPITTKSTGEDDSNPDSASRSSNPQSETNPAFSSKVPGFGTIGAQFANLKQAVDTRTKNLVPDDIINSLGRSKYTNHDNPFGSLESYSDDESEDDGKRPDEKSDSKSHSKKKSNESKGHHRDGDAGRSTSQEPGVFQRLGFRGRDIDTDGGDLRGVTGDTTDEAATIRSFMDQMMELARTVSKERDNHEARLKEIQIQLKKSQGRSEDEITRLRDQISALTSLCHSHFSGGEDRQNQNIQSNSSADPVSFPASPRAVQADPHLQRQKGELEEKKKILEGEVADMKRDLAQAKAQAEHAAAALTAKDVQISVLRKDTEQIQIELEEFKQQSQLMKSKVFTLEEKITETELQRNSAVKDIGGVIAQLRQSQTASQEKEAKITQLEGECSGLKGLLESSEAELQSLRGRFIPTTYSEQVAELQLQLNQKSQKVSELTKRVNQQEERVQMAQEAAFKNLESIKHNFLDDTQVKDKLESDCFGRLFLWVQSYVPRKTTASLQDRELENELQAVGDPKEIGQLIQKSPRIVFQALLYRFVTRHILSPPFHLYSAGGLTQSRSSTEPLKTLYDIFIDVDEVGCHTWRFHTFQLLEETRKKSSELAGDASSEQKDVQIQYCHDLAREFIEGPAKSFLGSCDSESRRLQELSATMSEIATLSATLWGQRVFLKVRGYDYFRDTPYSGSSPHVRAHNIHRLERKGEHSRDGAAIAMVVRPEIVAYGNEEGEEYDKERVWTKAIVMLGEE
ncbi:hypothetical protein TWF481_004425 [Arthrobotrys musiformis]|uniref:Uncharacterized protein n=1 Tax=Arthrobotrys musiformis TaxID=47236 RepID=A0AAV9WLJ7_9PEZI